MEQWKAIPGYEGYYEASNLGRVRGLDRRITASNGHSFRRSGMLLKQRLPKNSPYLRCIVSKHGKYCDTNVHVLVCTAFHGARPEGQWVRHLDGNPTNNRADNLAWGTPLENMADQFMHGTRLTGERMAHSKFTPEDVRAIRKLYADGHTQVSLASEYGVRQCTISAIVRRVNWAHVK